MPANLIMMGVGVGPRARTMPDRSDLTSPETLTRDARPTAADRPRRGVRAPCRGAIVFGLLANLPLPLFVLVDRWRELSDRLWVGAREDVLVYGAAVVGPLLGCAAILLSRRVGVGGGTGSVFARWAGWLSLATGIVVAYLARGLAYPCLLWSPVLFALMLLVVSERDPPE